MVQNSEKRTSLHYRGATLHTPIPLLLALKNL